MVAALLKIVSTGMQDQRLQPPKEQPELSAFLTVMVKAGRFGTQWVRVDFDTRPELGTAAVARLPVQGELVSRVFLVTTMPDIWSAQEEARKFVAPAKSPNGYVPLYFTGNGQYKKFVKYIYGPAQTTSGNTAPQGLQLEGLYPGGTYTVKVYVNPEGGAFTDPYQPQSTAQVYVTEAPLKLSDFQLIQNSTQVLGDITPEESSVNEYITRSSYDVTTWTTNGLSGGINLWQVRTFFWDGEQYIAGGRFPLRNIITYVWNTGLSPNWIQPNIFSGFTIAAIEKIGNFQNVYYISGTFELEDGSRSNLAVSIDSGQTWSLVDASVSGSEVIKSIQYIPSGQRFLFTTDFSVTYYYYTTSNDKYTLQKQVITGSFTVFAKFMKPYTSVVDSTTYRLCGQDGIFIHIYFDDDTAPVQSVYNDAQGGGSIDAGNFFSNVGYYSQLGVVAGYMYVTGGALHPVSVCLPFPTWGGVSIHGKYWQRPVSIGNELLVFEPMIAGASFPGSFLTSCLLKVENINPSLTFTNVEVAISLDGGTVYTSVLESNLTLEPNEVSNAFVFPILGEAPYAITNMRLRYTSPSGVVSTFIYTIVAGVLSISPATIQNVRILATSGTTGISNAANDIAWNGSYFLCVGGFSDSAGNLYRGTISKSSDGLIWSEPYNPAGVLVEGFPASIGQQIIWDIQTSRWILLGTYTLNPTDSNQKYVFYSTDGINWTQTTSEDSTSGMPIALGAGYDSESKSMLGGIFTQTGSGVLITSPDAITWSAPISMPNTISAVTALIKDILYDGSKYYVLGNGDGTSRLNLFTSTDLINWTKLDLDIVYQGDESAIGIRWNGQIYIIFGDLESVSTGAQGGFLYSTNGIDWTGPIQVNYPGLSVSIPFDMDYNGTEWIAVGYFAVPISISETQGYRRAKSTDGMNWTLDTTSALPNFKGSSDNFIVWNGSYWIQADQIPGYPVNQSIIRKSYDGINWNNYFLASETDSIQIKSLKWTGEMWVVGGSFTVGPLADLYSFAKSLDGEVWTFSLEFVPGESLSSITGTRRAKAFPPPFFFNANSIYTGDVVLDQTLYDPLSIIPGTYFRGGSVSTWSNSTEYGNGSVYQMYLYNNASFSNSYTFTFTPETSQMYLTVGCFQYLGYPVIIEITFDAGTAVDPIPPSPLIGPHFGWTNSVGHALIDEASVALGGVLMDTIPGELMEVLDEFQTPLEKVPEYSRQICRLDNGFNQSSFGFSPTPTKTVTPLPFWFSRGDPGCVLPIDALYVDEARITVRFRPVTGLYYTDSRAVDKSGNVVKSTIEGGSLWPILNSPFYYIDSSGSAVPGLEPVLSPGTLVSQMPGIKMPASYPLGDTYLLVEYVYLDKPEANRFRIADIQVPVVQHYSFDPYDNESNNFLRVPMFIPNPTRDLFFYCQRYEAPAYNAHFIGSRDLSNSLVPFAPWWPDASGLGERFYGTLRPGFSTRESEPLRWLALTYEETLVRFSTENVALFRSLLPAMEQRKAPWVNRYYYNLPFGTQNGFTPFSMPIGEANLDKIQRSQLVLGFHGKTGCLTADYVDRYLTRIFAETYNILRIYGGRATMLFAY